jgi:hypothetical protein
MVIPHGPGSLLIFSCVPHYLQNSDPERKTILKRHYRCAKRWFSGCSIAGAGAIDGYALVKDVISCELKARSYRSIGAIILGPALQCISIPLYIVTSTLKIQRYAVAIAEVGALVMRAEASFVSWSLLLVDLAIFGEVVPMFEGNNDWMIYQNNTTQAILSIAENSYGTNIMDEIASSIIPEVGNNVTEVLSTTTSILSHGDELVIRIKTVTEDIIRAKGEDFN